MHKSICELTDGPEAATVFYKEGNGRQLRLLFWFPEGEERNRNAVVWVHGGGLTRGRAEDYAPHSRYMAQRGAVGISVEYRLLTEGVPVEACIEDVADAVIYIRMHGEAFGIDPGKVTVVGESAGGFLAASLVSSFRDYDAWGRSIPDRLVNCNGVTDLTGAFLSFASAASEAEGVTERAHALSPIFHLGGILPPLLNLQGGRDQTVPPEMTAAFHREYLKKGGDSRMVLWPDASHAFLIPGYTATREQIDRAAAQIEDFIFRQQKQRDKPCPDRGQAS